ncbi:methenyltetrahydrofolate synthase domain-containing protein lost isoform 2-T2 [Glossina fuscipes fuscipes]
MAQNIEPTKRSLRVQTWRKLQENKYGVGFNRIFNRIPDFVNSDKAALMLAETDEFKNATNIKIMIDRALHVAKFQALLANKNLYLPGTRDSKALYLKVDVPPNATDEQKKEILNVQDVQNHRTEISLDTKIKLDMVVIGSVVVSRDGYRIGRGNGFNDLDIGLLTETGALTPETIIVTLVHDAQVVDNLPTNLFQKYDTPVDLIVTPTEVIHVDKRLPRPTGIFWELLSERRLKIIPVLQVLKETLEKEGKVITLKEIDTDIEQSQKGRRRGMMRRRYGNRRYQRRAISQTDTEQQQGENTEQRRFPRRRRFINRRRRPTKSEGDQSGIESMSQERRAGGGGGDGGNRRSRPRKNRPVLDFSIKVTNLRRGMRIKDLKAELRKRQCNPLGITWKASIGRCFLHFGNRNGQPSTDEDMEKVLTALSNLTLTINPPRNDNAPNANGAEGDVGEPSPQSKPPKTINLNVKLIKRNEKKKVGGNNEVNGDDAAGGDASNARIESVDATPV